jgi:hypothetical protein
MAVGDVAQFGPTSTANGSFLDLQPSAGVEVVIHNLGYGNAMELWLHSGSADVMVGSDATAGGLLNCQLHCTNTVYYRIKNVSGGAASVLTADGITTK